MQKIVIVGDGPFAEIAKEYFQDDGRDVVGFAVESNWRKRDELLGLPVVDFEDMEKKWPINQHQVFVACAYMNLNSLRTRLLAESKKKGYQPASYISPKAFVHRTAVLGEHCFIFEDNTIQPFVSMGSNNVLWSGNHIGHHSKLGNNNFISSHVVVSGMCEIGDNCFMGVNAAIANNLKIGSLSWIGMGANVVKSLPEKSMFKGLKGELMTVDSLKFWKMNPEDVVQ